MKLKSRSFLLAQIFVLLAGSALRLVAQSSIDTTAYSTISNSEETFSLSAYGTTDWVQFGVSGSSTAFSLTNEISGGSVGDLDTVGAVSASNDSLGGRTQDTSPIGVSYANGTNPASSSSSLNGSIAGDWSVQTNYSGGSPINGATLSFTIDFNQAISSGNVYVVGNSYAATSAVFTADLSNGNETTTTEGYGGSNQNDIFDISLNDITAGSFLTVTWEMTGGDSGYSNVSLDGVALDLSTLGLAKTLYYDTNGVTPGTASSSTQNFTDSVWTSDATGSSATTGYTPNSDVVFSAGSNGTGTQAVTVTDLELVHGFTFNNGAVTLYGSGSPSLSIGAGGITVNSNDGATTFDSSLGTVTLTASQSWNNNSTQALNLNSGISSLGSTVTFAGTGTGAVNLNGLISGALNLDDESATSTVYLNDASNNFSGTITVDGGTLIASYGGALGGSGNAIDLSGGGLLEFANGTSFNNSITLGTGGGRIDASLDGNGSGDNSYGGVVTGSSLTLIGGDFIATSSTASSIGTIDITGGRLLAYGNGIFGSGNATAVNVDSGGILDFAVSNTTLGNAITLADGSALESRTSGVVLNDVILPSTGTVTLGSDDVGGGSITINNAIALTGTLTLDVNANGGNATTVDLAGNISGSGSLIVNPGASGNSVLELTGNNTFNGPTTLNGVTVEASSTGLGTSAVTMNSAALELTGGTFSNSVVANTGTSYLVLVSPVDEVISSPLTLSPNGGSLAFINETASNNLTVGSIDFGSAGNSPDVYFNDSTTGMITLDGTYTAGAANVYSTIYFGNYGNGAGNYTIGPDANLANVPNITLDTGTLYIDNSSFVASQTFETQGYAGTTHDIEVVGSQDILASLYFDEKHGPAPFGSFTIDQSTANESVWSGYIWMDSTQMIISAVDGGRLDVTGPVEGESPLGVVKTGAGVVVFDDPNGNTFGNTSTGDSVSPGVTSPYAVDIQQGTLIVNNAQGYGLGNNSGSVNIENGATFGGTNTLAPGQTVISENAGSIIAPGDPGQASLGIAPKIGIITINGGLTTASNSNPATDGLTMDFKLNGYGDGNGPVNVAGVNNDLIIVNNLTLNGTITINLTAVGNAPLLTGYGNFYILMQGGTGSWTGDPTFVINTPAGYALDPTFGSLDAAGDAYLGYNYSITGQTLAIQLIAVPEPSTYAMMFVGLTLVGLGVRRKLT